MENRQIKVISGLSGSGKTVALRALEDIGYYCVDNLPIALLSNFADELMGSEDYDVKRAAVSVDSRNYKYPNVLIEHLKHLEDLDIPHELIFLDAEDDVLIQRFQNTRRTHPLMDEWTPLTESIQNEKRLLAPLLERANKHFDTTHFTQHDLRKLIQEDSELHSVGESALMLKSFAFKHGAPRDADFIFDVRCLPNPFHVEELQRLTGKDQPVIDYLSDKEEASSMIRQISEFLQGWLERFHESGRNYITVAVGCTGGQHRSVYVVEQLAKIFADAGGVVQKFHNDLD